VAVVGQIVGAQGHGIPTAFVFTVTDVTQGFVIDSETSAVGNGIAHQNKSTIECTGVEFDDRGLPTPAAGRLVL
jgi:hypothetical protein